MKIMALDLGDSRIGIAMSDGMGIIANGYETYNRQKNDSDYTYICNLAKQNNVGEIVIGLPINMDGSEGERVVSAREFGAKIAQMLPNIPIKYMDERLTTVSAERVLLEADISREKRKKVIDKIAATIILQAYLDTIKR